MLRLLTAIVVALVVAGGIILGSRLFGVTANTGVAAALGAVAGAVFLAAGKQRRNRE
jgi:TRAP-type mannitol/chloroaromatic compound transport system permease large subunit